MNKREILRISVATIIFSFTLSIFGQEKIGKEISERFVIKPNTNLTIVNKFGNIDIINQNKQSIEVNVKIVLVDINDKKAEEMLDMINIKHWVEGDKIIFETEFNESFNKSLSRLTSGHKNFEVNYTVKMPHNIRVDLRNKYGDIFVDKLSKPSIIALKYGKFKANNIGAENKNSMSEIILGYAEGTIEECSWLKVDIKYSKLKITESKALITQSKYSKIYIDRGSSLVSESKYDTYDIGIMANFVAEGEYSNFKFKSIGKKVHLETKYTDVKVGYMPASFESVKITNKYGGYFIGIEDGASYKLKGIANYGNISYPDNSNVNRLQESSELQVEGLVGTNEATNTKVYIETKYGSIKLAK